MLSSCSPCLNIDMKITLAQTNPVVGDIDGNLKKVIDTVTEAGSDGAELVVFCEMCLSGYPPKDLVERRSFIEQSAAALKSLEDFSKSQVGVGMLVGLPLPWESGGKGVVNVAALVADGHTIHKQVKSLLPTYDVFDEARYFDRAKEISPAEFKQFIADDDHMMSVTTGSMGDVKRALDFYMGKNTPARKEYIIENLIADIA